jgi:hypothetical protein
VVEAGADSCCGRSAAVAGEISASDIVVVKPTSCTAIPPLGFHHGFAAYNDEKAGYRD